MFRPGEGVCIILESYFSWMHCGDLNSVDKYITQVKVFLFIKGVFQLGRGRVLYIVSEYVINEFKNPLYTCTSPYLLVS